VVLCSGSSPAARLLYVNSAELANLNQPVENRRVTFEILGQIDNVETIAAGTSVRVRTLLNRIYGRGRWRKRKGFATVRLDDSTVRRVELHWYEAHGIGRRDFKIKTYAD
jgi:hypothetical protein